jgi:hypothetical protein
MFDARKATVDKFVGVRFFDIKGDGGELAGKGWVLDHSYLGAIDTAASIKGLRLRSGNMQVGEADVLEDLFTESRFNAWVVGEFHVLDDRILPNGRRDHFEQNVHFTNLLNQIRPIAVELSRRCRQSSIRRNVLRQFALGSDQVLHGLAVLRQAAVGGVERRKIVKEIKKELVRIEGVTRHHALENDEKQRLTRALDRYRRQLGSVDPEKQHKVFGGMSPRDKKLLGRLCSLIYECSTNKSAAKVLIDRVLSKLQD